MPGGLFPSRSGYLTVNATTGKNIFYWFAESQGNPATDPLIVWYQGGGRRNRHD
ncbi:MAG: hypothetical protein P4L40_02185 [Terracidiphilus sp.]|nr:hypothetical protein [Terracidiphilus sp.]